MQSLLARLTFSLALMPTPAFALDEYQVGRYVTQPTTAGPIQLKPLTEIVSFDPESQTVGMAMRELLNGTGYSLYPQTALPGFDYMPLPRVHQQFRLMQVIEILRALAGPAYHIIIIEPLRQIAFCFGETCQTHAGGSL